MGNMQAESNCVSFRLQGDYNYPFDRSRAYTSQVDGNQISRDDFVYNGPGGGGYGLCQWTFWSRKAGLYDLAKKRFVSIGNEYVQIDWLIEELHQSEYLEVLNVLNTSDSMYEMVKVFLRKFEKPADQSDSACAVRNAMANDIYSKYAGGEVEPIEPDDPVEPDEPDDPIPSVGLTLTPILKEGDGGTAVAMAQEGLLCLGYDLGKYGPYKNGVDGDFGSTTKKAVKQFQQECNLTVTGRVDDDTWQVLFQ